MRGKNEWGRFGYILNGIKAKEKREGEGRREGWKKEGKIDGLILGPLAEQNNNLTNLEP